MAHHRAHSSPMSTSVSRRARAGSSDQLPPATLLELVHGADAVDTGPLPALIRVVPGRHGPVLELRPVLDDPIDVLVGRIAPATTLAVGVRAPAHSHHLDELRPTTPGRVLHLVDTRGRSVTLLPGTGPTDPVIGPTDAALIGRVPEACRRQLGLPTPAATARGGHDDRRPVADTAGGRRGPRRRRAVERCRGPAPRRLRADHHAGRRRPGAASRRVAAGAGSRCDARWREAARASSPAASMPPRRPGWTRACSPAGSSPSSPRRTILLDVLDATAGPATADRLRAAGQLAVGTGES